MTDLRLSGTYTALVTPFHDDGRKSIAWESFDAHVEGQIEGGVDGVVPCGTTGESPTLTGDEQHDVIRRTVTLARGRVKVIAGTGSYSTEEAIARSRAAADAGVDAVMLVVPYYNKPTQEGLFRHFVAVAEAVTCPIVIYNIPSRTGVDLGADTLARIVDRAPNVVATKEATGNVLRAQELTRRLGSRLTVLCGDDALTLAMIAVGASGVISVTSNLLPREVSNATRLALAGRWADARKAHYALMPVHEAMFIEANPAPVKAALALRGKLGDTVRGPLCPLSEASRAKLTAALAALDGGVGR